MKLFLDTVDIKEIEKASIYGLIDGITTNPSLLAKQNLEFKEVILKIIDLLPHAEVSAEVVSLDYPTMLEEALKVSGWHPNIVVKVPMNQEGMRLVQELNKREIKTNVTLVFHLNQVLLAAKSGATYISTFVGRSDDISIDGMNLVAEAVNMINYYEFDSEILVASIRHPLHLVQSIQLGAHVVTMPYKFFEMMYHHPLTESGINKFLEDWKQAGHTI